MSNQANALKTLTDEHRLIEAVLDAMDCYVSLLTSGQSDDQQDLGLFVSFITEFADAHHHGKEEDILFAAMADSGFPVSNGPIAVMLHEHDMGRALIQELHSAVRTTKWTKSTIEGIADASASFGTLMRAHILKEDNVLYPMAENRLIDEEMKRLDQLCARYEEEHSAARHELESVARKLKEKYGH